MKHKTKDGKSINLNDLETSHLKNIISWIERKAKTGVMVRNGGGSSADDMWYEEEELFNEDALKELNYYEYVNELNRR